MSQGDAHSMLHPQLQQFLTLLSLFTIGKVMAFVYPSWLLAAAIIFWAFGIEHAMMAWRNGTIGHVSYSALSTALGVMLMLAVPQSGIYFVLMVLALGQKHFLRRYGYHFFNPSNFALMSALLLFYSQAHLVLGQLGDARWMRVLIVLLALAILLRVQRWMIPAVFVAAYLFFQNHWVVGYDPVLTSEMVGERFYSAAFIVFVVFMLTDPRTTPSKGWQQVLFGVMVAVIASGMDRWNGFRVQHLFMALFLLTPWVPWLVAEKKEAKKVLLLWGGVLFFVAMGAIILIENRAPYYYEMYR